MSGSETCLGLESTQFFGTQRVTEWVTGSDSRIAIFQDSKGKVIGSDISSCLQAPLVPRVTVSQSVTVCHRSSRWMVLTCGSRTAAPCLCLRTAVPCRVIFLDSWWINWIKPPHYEEDGPIQVDWVYGLYLSESSLQSTPLRCEALATELGKLLRKFWRRSDGKSRERWTWSDGHT